MRIFNGNRRRRELRDRLGGGLFRGLLQCGRRLCRTLLLDRHIPEAKDKHQVDDTDDTGELLNKGRGSRRGECGLRRHAAESGESAHLIVLQKNQKDEEQAQEDVDDDSDPKKC